MRKSFLLALALAVAGCSSGPDIAGTWDVSDVTGPTQMPPGSKMSVTFTKPDKAEIVNTMQAPMGASSAAITATISCTYSQSGTSLTLQGKEVKLEVQGIPEPMRKLFESQAEAGKKSMLDQINKSPKSTITWEGNDKFVAKTTDGSMTFTRRK
jgi:hypothetical protein